MHFGRPLRLLSSARLPRLTLVPLALGAILALPATPRAAAQEISRRAPQRDPEHRFRRHVWSWQEIKQRHIVMQQRDFSCGAAALATIIRYYWGDPATEEIFLRDLTRMLTAEELAEREANGLTLTDLKDLAVRYGYQAAMGKVSFDELTNSRIPLVVGIVTNDYDHFVVFRGWDGEWVYLADPTRGNIRIPTWQFVDQWQENAILLVVKPGQQPRDSSPLSVTGRDIHVGRTNWQMIRTFPMRSNP